MDRRTLDLALTSRLRYVGAPYLDRVAGAVHAELGDAEEAAPGEGSRFEVALRLAEGDAPLSGTCSRCESAKRPCPHVALLAVDLACSRELREAVLAGLGTGALAAQAPGARPTLDAELRFEGALAGWLAPAAEAMRIEMAASPVAADPHVGRAYGDRRDRTHLPMLALTVRRAGEKRLLDARKILPVLQFAPRDRRVLEHAQDRGSGKKAVYAVGTDASLAIEAMRVHRGVFAEGYTGLLRFKASSVRPSITHRAPSHPDLSSLHALSSLWIPDAPEPAIPFADALFFPGPSPFVWTRAGAIYPVAPGVDLDFAAELARAPELLVPAGKLRDAGARLLRAARGRGIVLPPRGTFGLAPPETPRIVLRLAGDPLNVTGELLAVYGAREVSLFPDDGVGSEDGRDLDHEARARAHVQAVGIVTPAAEDAAVDDSQVRASGAGAIAFWQTGLPALRAAKDPSLSVELSERLVGVRVGSPLVGRVHLTLEGHWLAAKLEFRSGDLAVEMEAIKRALARSERWVSLSDGTLARISSRALALAREASEVMEGDQGLLPAHQLGRLDRWVEDNDGRVDAAVEGLRGRLRALAVAAEPAMPRGLSATLRPYQRRGLAWLQFLESLGAGGILADDMGLGKTITTLAFLLGQKETLGPAPSLVVCPTSVATNWVREAERFTPGLRVALYHGPSPARAATPLAESDLVVTTYALLRRDLEVLSGMRFRCVVLDEAQNIKNKDSVTTRAAARLDASMRLALTGTPVENRLHELWSLASFANPGMLGTSNAFETRFETPLAADPASPAAGELRAVIRPFLLRRTKTEVLAELPPKTEIDLVVTLGNADRRLYDSLAHSLRRSLKKISKKRPGLPWIGVFTALTRLRQMACDPRLVDPRLAPGGGVSAKREAFLELVRELVAEGRRALVFSQFVQLLTLWRKDLDDARIAYEYLDGSTTSRELVVQRFQNGTAPLFLISLKAGGAGLNLTAADTVIHCDPWWNPAVEDQATDRAYRIGQAKPVTVVRLLARGTIEEKMSSLKANKRELANAILGGDAGTLAGLTEEDVRLLLGDPGEPEEDTGEKDPRAPTDVLATESAILDPDYAALVVEVEWWLASAGKVPSELASLADLPLPFAARLSLGEPFPCSRAVAERIRARLRAW